MEEINIMIEPHFDDIWLSCGNYILKNPKKKFVIISIAIDETNNSFNSKLLMQYCPQIIKTFSMLHDDYGWKQREKQVIKTLEEFFEQRNRYIENFKKEKIFIEKEVHKFIDEYKGFTQNIFMPIGVQNPMHVIVSNLFFSKIKENIYLYRDVPYAFKNKYAFLFPDLMKEWEFSLFYENDGSNNKKKFEIFKAVYPRQFFLRESCENSKEEIYQGERDK